MHTAPLPLVLWTVSETLFDGSRRKLAEHLSHTQRMAWPCPEGVWAIVWEPEPATWTGPPDYHPED